MKSGTYFNWPETSDELRDCWNSADELTDDTTPTWMDEDEREYYRYLCHSSWAYISADDQDAYFEEIDSAPDFIVSDADEGDGCVTHFYIRLPWPVQIDQALAAAAAYWGRNWKSQLRTVWANGRYPSALDSGTLQRIRNQFGPSWLHKYRLPS